MRLRAVFSSIEFSVLTCEKNLVVLIFLEGVTYSENIIGYIFSMGETGSKSGYGSIDWKQIFLLFDISELFSLEVLDF